MSKKLALASLKEDIKLLEKIFSKKNSTTSGNSSSIGSSSETKTSCFRIITASVDELVCEFIDCNAKKYRINANICVIFIVLKSKISVISLLHSRVQRKNRRKCYIRMITVNARL